MTGGRIMSKIVNITSKEDKDQKLQDIANSLEELKDVMAEVIEAYEEKMRTAEDGHADRGHWMRSRRL